MIHLNVHSSISMMEGFKSPHEICQEVALRGEKYVALTDTNGFYGLIHFLNAAKEYALNPIVGSEVVYRHFRVLIYPLHYAGYQMLCQLITKIKQNLIDEHSFFKHLALLYGQAVFVTDHKQILLNLKQFVAPTLYFFEASPGFFKQADIDWCLEKHIPIVATARARYIEQRDFLHFQLLRAIKENSTFNKVDLSGWHTRDNFLFSDRQAQNYFSHIPQALQNTAKIAEQLICDWYPRTLIFPTFQGLSELAAGKLLLEKCMRKISWRYPAPNQILLKKIRERLHEEHQLICKMGFSAYFLVVDDIVSKAEITCGRGSSAACIISYLLGITHVDPLKYDLKFDRFLNIGRKDPPDIDIDFPWDERDAILDYVFSQYPNHSAMVANQNYFGWKSGLREIAKVFGVPADEISYIIKRYPRMTLNSKWTKIAELAKSLSGVLRHLSVHCGGVVITPNPIDTYVPVEISAKGVPVIQWEKDQSEDAGLVKIDLLGNRSLAVQRDCIQLVNQNRQKKIDYKTLNPLQDQKIFALIRSGKTMGCFYGESPASSKTFMQMLKEEQQTSLSLFDIATIALSIIRPASNQFCHEFVERLRGKPFQLMHPLLADVLGETLGIMVYQEQVTHTAIHLANFDIVEGNLLRKVLGKKHKEKTLKDLKEKFYTGAKKNEVKEAVIDNVWQQILSFSGYSFCKPHSASYVLVFFKSVWLKAMYPAEFMSAVLANHGGFYAEEDYLEECRRMNLKILGPCVNKSQRDYWGMDDWIRKGFVGIKGLNKSLSENIIVTREKAPYKNVLDFCQRLRPTFEDAKLLVKVRAFHACKTSTYTNQMREVYYYKAQTMGLIDEQSALPTKYIHATKEEYASQQLISWELTNLQAAVTFPKWAIYREALNIKGRVQAIHLKDHVGQTILLFATHVTTKHTWTKQKLEMAFVSFSDETDIFKGVMFPETYSAYRDVLLLGGAFYIKGVVQNEYGSYSLQIFHLKRVTA